MTTAMPPLATFSELLRSTVRTSMTAVTEGSRRNARDAISARVTDAEAAGQLLAALAPVPPPRRSTTPDRSDLRG